MTTDQPRDVPPPVLTGNPAYDAVYAYIRGLGDYTPPDPVHRNAIIWRAIQVARTTPDDPATSGAFQDVRGYCPACHNATLFLGDGGYVTCSLIGCPQPDAASTLLERRDAEAPCGLIVPGVGAKPLGPCVVVGPHEEHKAGDGTKWRPTPRAVVQSVTRQQLHDAIRELTRTDRKWWHDEVTRYNLINGGRAL